MSIRMSMAIALLAISTNTIAAAEHSEKTGFALSSSGKELTVIEDLSKPKSTYALDLAVKLDAIAWRPVTGELLGFSRNAIYKVDTSSGTLTDLDASFKADAKISEEAAVAFDFNNKIDAVRAVSSAGDNLVYFPQDFGNGDKKAGTVQRFTNLAYAPDDTNARIKPKIFANAYTNAINGKKAGDTYQYALDAETNALVSLANNKGTLKTIGPIKIDGKPTNINAMGGFDIVSEAEGKDAAFAILRIEGQGTAGIYSIDLASGSAKLLHNLGNGTYSGFAASISQ